MKRILLSAAVAAVVVFGAIALLTRPEDQTPQHPGTPVKGEAPRFKFAVVADVTGGSHPSRSIFIEALEEINTRDPDFTICVGNLIRGNHDDPKRVKSQWDAFDADIRRLRRPFYYVFGENDASSRMMQEVIRKRYGRPYYSFDYPPKHVDAQQRCHFIVMFSETYDRAGKFVGLDDDVEQITWLRRDLAANRDAAHTFVFYHRPWASDEIMKLFAGRPTTVFTGHDRAYRQFEKDGVSYHVLSSTGGEIEPDFYGGRMYHYMWVTVSGEKVTPEIVRMGASRPNTFLSVDRLKRIEAARSSLRNVSLPVAQDARSVDGTLEMKIPNPLARAIRVVCRWEIPPDSPWSVEPEQAEFTLGGDTEKTLRFRVRSSSDPFNVDVILMPRFRIHALGGRSFNAASPEEGGLDTLYDYVTPLKVTRQP